MVLFVSRQKYGEFLKIAKKVFTNSPSLPLSAPNPILVVSHVETNHNSNCFELKFVFVISTIIAIFKSPIAKALWNGNRVVNLQTKTNGKYEPPT